MKKILIVGATGRLARYVIEAFKPMANAQRTLFVRDKKDCIKA
jgi:hypothetical protein